MKQGKVYLVGAGPGDPGLITVKGLECIKRADVIIYDYLASATFLKYALKDAELIYVGKKGGDHTLAQEKINQLIIEKAKKGHVVTRLKGGDPFIFGRGGEEAEILFKEAIPFEVVPGVTSAIAAPAYAGIPLTHRDHTSTVAFVTGHENPNKKESSIDWSTLSKGIGTLVFFMGVKNLPYIVNQLIHHGKTAHTPIGLVRWGTTPQQVTITGTLDTIVSQATAAGFKAPAIIVVGDVVKLRKSLQWFEKRPLFGKRIVVTRAREQASDLVNSLADLGAECLECPTIKIIPADDPMPLDRAIHHISDYEWLVFTSVNGVEFFFKRLFVNNRDVRHLHKIRTATIGPATSKKLLEFGLKSDILPKDYRAESILQAFAGIDIKGKKILLPRARDARPLLPVELTRMGAYVDEIIVYHTIENHENSELLISRLEELTIDLITFTSSSTVKNFKALLPTEKFEKLIEGVTIATIGPITAATAKDLGFDVHIIAEIFSISGLCDAILQYFYKSNGVKLS